MDKMPIYKIPLRGKRGNGLFALVDGDYDGEYFAQFKWYLGKHGYVYRRLGNSASYLHSEVSKPPRGLWTDHIDRNKLNNRSCNLRWVTPKENAQNRPSYKRSITSISRPGFSNNKYGYRGISPQYNRWRAFCSSKLVGSYETKEQAAKAYDKAAKDRWGDKAILNFP